MTLPSVVRGGACGGVRQGGRSGVNSRPGAMWNKTGLLLSAFLLALTAHAQERACTATVETVAGQAGEAVVFCGTPSEVYLSARADAPIKVNFGGTYPDQAFSVVIFPDVLATVPDSLVKQLTGHAVRAAGVVKMYKGKPEIVVRSAADITVE